MLQNSEFCVYGGIGDEVHGVEENPDYNVNSDKKLENNIIWNVSDVHESRAVNQLDDEFKNADINLYGEDIDDNVIKKISSMSIDDVKEDVDDNYENGKAFLYNQVLKGYIENKNQLEELEWECHTLDDIPEEEEPETDSSEMDLNENVLQDLENKRLENDSMANSLADVLEESVPTSTLLCEETAKVLSEDSMSLGKKLMIETPQLSVSSSDSLEDPVRDTSEISSNNEEFDGVSQKIFKDPYLSTASREREEDSVSETLEISSSKETVCVSQKLVEDHPHSMTQDSIEDPIPDPLEISSSKDFDSVPERFVGDPPFSLASQDRIESPVPDKPEISPSKELDCVPLGISEDRHDSMASRGRIEEAEQILVPDMLEPASAAASQAIRRKKRFSGLRKLFARMCCCVKKKTS